MLKKSLPEPTLSEMSGSMGGRGADGNGANHFESTGTGLMGSAVRSESEVSDAGRGRPALKVTDRHVRRMLVRLREGGDGALVHGLRGRPSNRPE